MFLQDNGTVTQRQFFEIEAFSEKKGEAVSWTLPINGGQDWFANDETNVTLSPNPSMSSMISHNFYTFSRYQYSRGRNTEIIEKLIDDLNQYSDLDRTQYVDDLFSLILREPIKILR